MRRRPCLFAGGALALLAVVSACDCGRKAAEPPPASEAAEGAQQGPRLRISLNGRPIRTIGVAEIEPRKRLVDLLPAEAADPAAWKLLEAHTDRGGAFRFENPAKRFDDHVVELYLAGDKKPSVGLFRRIDPSLSEAAKRALARPAVFLVDAAEVDIWTVEPPKAPPPVLIPLKVVLSGAENRSADITEDELKQLPRVKLDEAPGAAGRENDPAGDTKKGAESSRARAKRSSMHEGWHLRSVAALRVPPKRIAKVTVEGADGSKIEVSAELLEAPDALPMLRRNQRGALGVEMLGTGPDGTPLQGRLRDVVKMTIETRAPHEGERDEDAPAAKP